MNLIQTVSKILCREVGEQEAMEFALNQYGLLTIFNREWEAKVNPTKERRKQVSDLNRDYNKLEDDAINMFQSFLDQIDQGCVFKTESEGFENCDIITISDEINGGSYEVYVTGITKLGMIEGTDVNDTSNKDAYKFTDIQLVDKLNVLSILESNL